MIVPFLQGESLLADIARATSQEPDHLHVWWLGQSGYLIAVNGTRIVLDPYLSDSLTTKYATTDKPHTRMTERVLYPAALTGIDLVTASHQHTDHLDSQTLIPLLEANPDAVLVLPRAHVELGRERVGERNAARLVPLNPGETYRQQETLAVTAVPAAHEELAVDAAGNALYLGFVVTLDGWTLYHSGDTVRYPGMAERLTEFGIDLAFLPINGRLPERRVSGNLWGDEAAQLAHDAGIGLVVPGHYELFTFNTEPPDLFVTTCERLRQPYRVLRAGERLRLPPRG